MAYENAASGDSEYFTRLQAEERSGQLQADTRAAMIEQAVNPELQDGLYVEIGFGADPYAVKTSRVSTEESRKH
jgi:hypothetical protein